jgi:hypothetical protein
MMRNIVKRNRLFDRILKEALSDYETTDENDDYQLQVATGFLDKPLETIFSDVLQACRKENELNYSNLTVSKKSIPFYNA